MRTEMAAIRTEMVAVEQRSDAKMAAIRTEMVAVEQRSDAKMAAMEQRITEHTDAKIEEARREAGAMMESILHEIRALPEGLSTFQRQEADRLDAMREEAMLTQRVRPLEASVANHEKRIKAVEQGR
jgi:hypothetical protein